MMRTAEDELKNRKSEFQEFSSSLAQQYPISIQNTWDENLSDDEKVFRKEIAMDIGQISMSKRFQDAYNHTLHNTLVFFFQEWKITNYLSSISQEA